MTNNWTTGKPSEEQYSKQSRETVDTDTRGTLMGR